jgi:hypothetical protein
LQLGEKSTQILLFLSFTFVAVVTLKADRALSETQQHALTMALRWWVWALLPILIGILPLKDLGWGDTDARWYNYLRWFKFGLLWIAIILVLVGAAYFGIGIWPAAHTARLIVASELSSSSQKQPLSSLTGESRFVFPTKSSLFPDSSIALDTTSGKLCKTYPWEDSGKVPKGLPMCSDLSASRQTSFTGAAKAYRGFTYRFNGTRWVKEAEALKYNEKTQGMDPLSEDQYDPLNLFSKKEKAMRTLKVEQIRSVADQFGVTYAEAWEDAKAQGYMVPPER